MKIKWRVAYIISGISIWDSETEQRIQDWNSERMKEMFNIYQFKKNAEP